MANKKQPSYEDLQTWIKELEEDLAFEKKINWNKLNLPVDAPAKDLPVEVRWSTEWIQLETDLHEVTDGAVTDVYDQRVFKLIRLKNGHIFVNQHNGKAVGNWREPCSQLKIKPNEGSFFMLLELMQFAAREFDNNRDEVVAKLTHGKGIKVRRSINAL